MDEHNFQQQLHVLKQRVSSLSSRYTPQYPQMSLPSFNSIQDPFPAQLRELKAHVASIERSLQGYEHSIQQSSKLYQNHSCNIGDQQPISVQNNFTLPSGPIFWQLFNSLRTDIGTLDSRVSKLEVDVSDLEDRVDGMDPNRFTPPGSTATSEIDTGQAVAAPKCTSHDFRSQSRMMPELCTDTKDSQGCLPIPAEPQVWSTDPWCHNTYSGVPYPPGFPGDQRQPISSWYHNYSQPQQQDVARFHSNIASSNSAMNRLQEQNNTMQSHISKLDRDNEKLLHAIKGLARGFDRAVGLGEAAPLELPARSNHYAIPESVVFRDREIARMDEQLRIAHERLRASEETVAKQDHHIEQLRSERDKYDAREQAEKYYQKKEQLTQYRNKLAAKDSEIRDLQDQVEERNQALHGWEESWNKLEEAYVHAKAKAKAYEDWYNEKKIRDDDAKNGVMDEMAAAHGEEMNKLKEFCEQKDAVIQKQEEIIARGGKLLEQRDNELGSMQRKLRAVEDDREHAIRTEQRVSRLLEERDSELTRLIRESKSTQANPGRSESRERDNSSMDIVNGQPEQKALQSAPPRSTIGAQADSESQPWVQVGESAAQFRRMPPGERRAYVWDNNARELVQESETPEGRPPLPNDANRRARAGGRHRRHPYRHYPELQNQTNSNWYKPHDNSIHNPQFRPFGELAITAPKQDRQPQNDMTRWPPLPAPVTARRMASEADLHSTSHNNLADTHRRLVKHQSMQFPPKRSLQPYVETEGESGEEVGREV